MYRAQCKLFDGWKWLLLLGVGLTGSWQPSWKPGIVIIHISPRGDMKVKVSPLMCYSADLCMASPELWLCKPLSFPLCLLPLCLLDVVTFFLTLRWIFLILLDVSFLPCFPIAYADFNYILLIAFHRWASYAFLSLPLVFKSCLHLFRRVCPPLPLRQRILRFFC